MRTDVIARTGLRARDALTGAQTYSPASVVGVANRKTFDRALVAVRLDDLDAVAHDLATLSGRPVILFFGNNPSGRVGLPAALPGAVHMGFPGVGGTLTGDVAEYVRIAQQPTVLEASPEPRLDAVQSALAPRGFAVQRVPDMSGWLAYHAVFVASIAAALYRCQTDPQRLAADRGELKLMCRAITDGFRALRTQGVTGLPRNLAVLHSPALRPIAVHYWARSMRSPIGELAFAAHCRHAEPEMRALAREVLAAVVHNGEPTSLERLLKPG